MFDLAKLEKMKDIVEKHRGRLEIRVYLPSSRDYFMISFEDGEAAYRKVTACGGDQRETFEKLWPSLMVDIMASKSVSARLKFDGERPVWFDTSKDARAFEKMFRHVLSLDERKSSRQARRGERQ